MMNVKEFCNYELFNYLLTSDAINIEYFQLLTVKKWSSRIIQINICYLLIACYMF
jgi:hypothetical protein